MKKNIIIVKEVAEGEDYAQMNNVAAAMLDAVGRDDEGKTHVAYGTIVRETERSLPFLQGSQDGHGCGKDFFGRIGYLCIQFTGDRQTDLSASDSSVQKCSSERSSETSLPDDFDEETLTTIN